MTQTARRVILGPFTRNEEGADHAMVTPHNHPARAPLLRRGLRLEYLTIGWNVVECAIAIALALAAGSVALLGFGADSAIESLSGAVLIWRLRAERHDSDPHDIARIERRAERLIGLSFLLLAAFVAIEATRALLGHREPQASPAGMALLLVSIAVMLWLARAKHATAAALDSRALAADAAQTLACWRLSIIALAGIALNAALGWWWVDPLAALAITVLLAQEGVEAFRGDGHH